jgi:hypothetical protein
MPGSGEYPIVVSPKAHDLATIKSPATTLMSTVPLKAIGFLAGLSVDDKHTDPQSLTHLDKPL